MKQKEKKGEWKKDLVEDEATEGMLKEKVDDMVRKLVKMKVKRRVKQRNWYFADGKIFNRFENDA